MPVTAPSPAAEELYEALAPAFTEPDEDGDLSLLGLCNALVSGSIDAIHLYVTEQEGRPGWQIILDPQRAPAEVLPWLAQFDGATLRPDMDTAQRRDAIVTPEAFGRGTIPAIERVAKRRLTGTKTVIITERYTGSAWRLRIETIEGETPEPEKTEQEIVDEQKPIGIVLFFNSRAVWDWAEVVFEKATWLKLREDFPTWFDVRTYEP
jgi:Phage tail protein (Tail_P2_I)